MNYGTEIITTAALPPAKSPEVVNLPGPIQARWEAADPINHRLWPGADGLSADAAADPAVRRALRQRCRNEIDNNPLLAGIVKTWADDLIGIGPTLQLQTEDDELNEAVEGLWHEWSRAVRLAQTLRVMARAKPADGESFLLFSYNPEVGSPVKMHPRLIEADRVTTPGLFSFDTNEVDGLVFDSFGNVKTYHVLKHHPGDQHLRGIGIEKDDVPAAQMVHYFEPTRAGQHRGIPTFAPSLMMAALLRRYCLATVKAAETVADIAVILHTQAPPVEGAANVPALSTMELEYGSAVAAPQGWAMSQPKAEQPTQTFTEARKAFVSDMARPVSMPLNVAMCDSSDYNYASGRLDHQTYFKAITVERDSIGLIVLDPVFAAFIEEAALVLPEPMRAKLAAAPALDHKFFWPGFEHVDPEIEANAQTTRLDNFTTTLQDECAREGKDWAKIIKQRKRELTETRELREMQQPEPKPGDAPDAKPKEGAADAA